VRYAYDIHVNPNANDELRRINAQYEVTHLPAAKRQIAPLILAINALGNLTMNFPDKALQVRT